jgi:mono/diheme cytochrome c family protein
MKRTLFASTAGAALLLILTLGLAACGGGAPSQAAPVQASAGDPVVGERIFASACAACHGMKGEGVPGLSQDMTQGEFAASATDLELVEFIKVGGLPDEPLVMLPKGGIPSLTDPNLVDIVAYIRWLQD